MDKTAIKNFSIWARNKLIADITYKAGLLGVTEEGIKDALPQSTQDAEFYDIGTKEPYAIHGEEIKQRKELVAAIKRKASQLDYKDAYRNVVEEVAYTWFNRLIAIRFMEVNDYMPAHIRVLSSDSKNKLEPDLVTTPLDAELDFTQAEIEKIMQMKNDNQVDALFRFLFIKQCNALNAYLPKLFEKTSDYTELLLNVSVTDQDGIVYHLTHDIAEADFNIAEGGQVEIIGWLYQYYNTEDFNAIYDGNLSKEQVDKYLVPAATQLFTPDWVVRYMIENTLGRMWVEGHSDSELVSQWKYYVHECEQDENVKHELNVIKSFYAKITPENIKVIDPCMGSGHILVYAFDVLMQIYETAGYSQRDAAELILQNNIFGLDIDERAHQLSYFAIMMKARQYNRRILTKNIKCNVYAIVESNDISLNSLAYFGEGMSTRNKEKAVLDITELIKTYTDAKEYGSILNVEKYDWSLLREFLDSEVCGQIGLDAGNLGEAKERLSAIIDIAEIMSQKYEVVCTNPPYLGSGKFSYKLSQYIEKNYYDEKPDLGMVMLNKMLFSYADKYAYLGAITTVSWMFIKSFEKFRTKVLQSKDFVCLVDFGTELFEGKIGHLPVVSWINRNSLIDQRMTAIRLVDFCYSRRDEKEKEFYNRENYYSINQSELFKIQGVPIAYWISESVLDAFGDRNIGSISEPRMGLTTGRNNKYLRLWYEVALNDIGFGYNREKAQLSGLRWFPYDKGGDYRKWFGNRNFVVDWLDDGHEMQTTMHPDGKRIWAHNFNLEYNYKEHISWNDVVLSELSFRYFEEGFLFDSAAATIFVPSEKKYALLAYLNSDFVNEVAKLLNPTVHFKLGDYAKLPYGEWDEQMLSKIAQECIAIAKADWDSYETSWDFEAHPLVEYERKIKEAVTKRINYVKRIKKELAEKERIINDYFCTFYNLSAKRNSEKEGSTIYVPSERDLIVGLISYAVGCMFGRYSLDAKGIVCAGEELDKSKYNQYIPNEDNVVLILDEEYLDNDIVGMFFAWIKAVYGAENFVENIDYIAEALSGKGNTSSEVIRGYFLSDFYKEHSAMYSVTGSGKRPIYWLFDSGKQNGFKALIYMHRYNADTIGNLRVDYLHRMERIYENEINRMQDTIDNSSNAREVTAATKRKEKLQKQLKECQEYDEKIGHLALSRIDIDLDDGVKVNYEKVQTANDGKKYQVLAKI